MPGNTRGRPGSRKRPSGVPGRAATFELGSKRYLVLEMMDAGGQGLANLSAAEQEVAVKARPRRVARGDRPRSRSLSPDDRQPGREHLPEAADPLPGGARPDACCVDAHPMTKQLDALHLVEAAYDPALDDHAWLKSLAGTAASAFGVGGVGLAVRFDAADPVRPQIHGVAFEGLRVEDFLLMGEASATGQGHDAFAALHAVGRISDDADDALADALDENLLYRTLIEPMGFHDVAYINAGDFSAAPRAPWPCPSRARRAAASRRASAARSSASRRT